MKRPIILLALTVLLASISFAQDDVRAAAAWQVKSYDIAATVPQGAADRSLTAKATLNLQNVGNAAGSRVTLRIGSTATISTVTVNGNAATFIKGEEKLPGSQRSLQRAIVTVPTTQPNGAVTIVVDYIFKVEENSGVHSSSSLGSQFLPLGFWYPTPNNHYAARGGDYAPFKLTVNAPAGETVIASGTQTGNSFEQKLNGQPFFATGSWDTTESKGITIFLPKGATDQEKQRATEIANLVVEAKAFTASLLGATSVEVPSRVVAVRQGAGFADSGTIFLDYGAFRRPKLDSVTAMNIAESVAKVWIGNNKIVRGDGFGAIREGLSLYVATQFLEKQYGKDVADIERLRQRTGYSTIANRDTPLNMTSPLDGSYFSSVANKGAMVWRTIANQMSAERFFGYVKTQDPLTVLGIRTTFSDNYEVIDQWLQSATDMNLMAGLPRVEGGGTKVALRNTGGYPAHVTVGIWTDKGEKLTTKVSIPKQGFTDAVFNTTAKVIRAEVDTEKLYPQLDYSDDVAPREFTDSDMLLPVKRAYDKQDYKEAEKFARLALKGYPRYDEMRTWLARALLGQNNVAEAEREFKAALDEKLPTAFTQGWANIGLAEIAVRAGQNSQAAGYYSAAIRADAEYGSNLNARRGRAKVESGAAVDDTIKAFFAQFDKAILSSRKAEVDALIVPGEITKFSGGVVSGQPSVWQTRIVRAERIDAVRMLVETEISAKRLNSELTESGTAIFVISRIGNTWKLSGVDVFEVR